jgi:hypothetical protein
VPDTRVTLTLAGVLAIGAAAALRAPPSRPVHLLFTGDILLSRQVAVEMRRTGASPFDSVGPLFRRADWVGGNLEGAIGPEGECRGPDTTCFAFPDITPALLARAGLSAVTVENNHAADLGSKGRERTREVLRRAGILGVDFARSPGFMRVGGVTVAVIAVSLVRAVDGRVDSVPSVALAQKLRLGRALADLVVVSIHWGTELQDWSSDEQRRAAEWLVDEGADLVVGHHPHVVQPPACVHGRPVFFSLGNHVFDQRYPETKEGLIADCTVERGRLRCGGVHTHARRGSAMPVVTDGAPLGALVECTVKLRLPIEAAGYTLRAAPWSSRLPDSGVVIEGWRDGAVRWTTRRVSVVSLQSGLAARNERLLFSLERHPSAMDGEVALRPHVYAVSAQGLIARWRGTALAWPLIDATLDGHGRLCALHRGDSFISPEPRDPSTRTMVYAWNSFGFSALDDRVESAACASSMRALIPASP